MIKVGNPVQFRERVDTEWRAAIVTKVHDDRWVSVFVMQPDGYSYGSSMVEKDTTDGRGWREIPPDPYPYSGI